MASASALVLPEDVLRIIFDHFRHVEVLPGGKVDWDALRAGHERHYDQGIQKMKPRKHPPELRCLQNLRLTCRSFHAIASPLLVPVLRISLSRESLEHAETLVNNKFIRDGIRGIQVALDYRPRKLTESLEEFERYRAGRLQDFHLIAREEKVVNRVQRTAWTRAGSDDVFGDNDPEADPDDMWDTSERQIERRLERAQSMSGRIERDDTNDETKYQDVHVRSPRSAKSNRQFNLIDKAWYHVGGRQYKAGFGYPDIRRPDRTNPFVKALERGFLAYCAKQKEQTHLIVTGDFVKAVTAIVTRIDGPVRLAFVELDKFPKGCSPWEDPGYITTNAGVMQEFLESPVPWHVISQDISRKEKILPVKVLTELPIAIHMAGGQIGAIAYWAFPKTNLSFLVANPSNAFKTWKDLRRACRGIDSFFFSGTTSMPDWEHEESQDKGDQELAVMFIRSCVTSPDLEDIDINANFLAKDNYERLTEQLLPMHRMFEALSTKRVQRFILRSVEMSESDFDLIIDSFGDRFEWLALGTVVLTDGRWADIFDKLREKYATFSKDQKRGVMLRLLADSSFNAAREIGRDEMDQLQEAEDYVLRLSDVNPLRNDEA